MPPIDTLFDPSKLSKKRILVTGATGFLGSHLCRLLCRSGAEVHGISRNPQPAQGRLHWWQGDLSDFATTQSLLHSIKPVYIFHLTAHAWGARGIDLVRPTLQNDLVATVNLLTAASEFKIERLLLTGSIEEPMSGNPEAVPSSPYGAAKWASGAYARMFHRLYGTPAVIVRIFMAYGPGQPDKKLIPYTIYSLLKGEAPELSDGRRLIDWIYVDDVIEGLLAAAQAPGLEGSTIDVGSGDLLSIRDVVEHLVGLVRPEIRPLFGAAPARAMESVRAADIKSTYQRIGWKPATSWHKGLELTVDWYTKRFMDPDHEVREQSV